MSFLALGQIEEPVEYVEDLWQDPATGEVLYEPLTSKASMLDTTAYTVEAQEPLPLPPAGYVPYNPAIHFNITGTWRHPVTGVQYVKPYVDQPWQQTIHLLPSF